MEATLPLAEYFFGWYQPCRLFGRSTGTTKNYRSTIARFSRTLCRPASVSDLSDRRIALSLQALASTGAAPATLEATRRILCALGNFAWKKKLLDEPPMVPSVPFETPEATAYSTEEVGRILAAAGLPQDSRSLFQKVRRSCAQEVEAANHNATRHLGHSSAPVTRRYYLRPEVIDATYLPQPGNGVQSDFCI